MGRGCVNHPYYFRKNLLCFPQHIVIPETQYNIAIASQSLGSDAVVFFLLQMLSAIQFDSQPDSG